MVTELSLAPNPKLTHVRLENFAAAARQTAATIGEIGEKAAYRGFYFSQGGHFARHEALLKLAGEEADARIDAAYMVADKRHCDNTTVIDHAVPNTTSHAEFPRRARRGPRAASIRAASRSRRPRKKPTHGNSAAPCCCRTSAEIVTKPELEIFADDVKCSHGATAGELDANALFFLRARGIPEAEARAMLVEAFLGRGDGHHRERRLCARLRRRPARIPGCRVMPARPPMSNSALALDASRPPSTSQRRARISRSCRASSTTSRWSIWTMAPRRRSRRSCSTRSCSAYADTYANVHRGAHFLSDESTVMLREGAQIRPPFRQRQAGSRKSSSPRAARRRSISSPRASARKSAKATRSSSPRWSITPTSCRGIFCASARARNLLWAPLAADDILRPRRLSRNC